MMEISKESVIGFFLGIALITIVNTALLLLNRSTLVLNGYVFVVSYLVLVFFIAIKLHLLKKKHR